MHHQITAKELWFQQTTGELLELQQFANRTDNSYRSAAAAVRLTAIELFAKAMMSGSERAEAEADWYAKASAILWHATETGLRLHADAVGVLAVEVHEVQQQVVLFSMRGQAIGAWSLKTGRAVDPFKKMVGTSNG